MSSKIVCPHCGMVGMVKTKRVKKKQGISGGKVVGAVVTLGWSMLATGLSQKNMVTEAHCKNCKSKWAF